MDPSNSTFQPFEYRYVDKTGLLADIMSQKSPKFILDPAPRRYGHFFWMNLTVCYHFRFGKSLTLNQLGALARGEKSKFEGYDVVKRNLYDFSQEFSVLQLDFSLLHQPGDTPHDVEIDLAKHICDSVCDQLQLHLDPVHRKGFPNAAHTMKLFIDTVRKQHPNRLIVLTIDEYDHPVNSFIHKGTQAADEMAQQLAPFYTLLKSKNADIFKSYVTGISKLSIFSGNNQTQPIREVLSFNLFISNLFFLVIFSLCVRKKFVSVSSSLGRPKVVHSLRLHSIRAAGNVRGGQSPPRQIAGDVQWLSFPSPSTRCWSNYESTVSSQVSSSPPIQARVG